MISHPLRIAISAPTGFNTRELLLPLASHLTADSDITQVVCITPAAAHAREIFGDYGPKFTFVAQPADAAAMQAYVAAQPVDVVVTPTNGLDPLDVPILEGAQKAGIPTLTFVSSWDNVHKMGRAVTWQRPYVVPDAFAVWNEAMREHVLQLFPTFNQQRLRLTGAPRFDFFSHRDRIPTRTHLLQHMGLPSDTAKLIHIATTELYPMEYVVRTVAETVGNEQLGFPAHIVATVHPGGDIEKHKQYAEKYGVKVLYAFGRRDSAPLKEFLYAPTINDVYLQVALFAHADALINHSSTTALESMLADVPVINVRYGQRFDWWRWHRSMVYRDFHEHYKAIIDSGATAVAHNPQQLSVALKEALLHPDTQQQARQSAAQKLLTVTDGTAGNKLLAFIKEITQTSAVTSL